MRTENDIGTSSWHYARCIEVSRHIRWDLERDVIRGRRLDKRHKFLPDGLSLVHRLGFLHETDQRLLSQVQGRTYANMIQLVERFINAKMLDLARSYWLGDQIALEALVRFVDEELKHQELFRRIDALAAECLPDGYRFLPQLNEFASFVLDKSTWSVLALIFQIGDLPQTHYRQCSDNDDDLSPLFKDVFFFHWKEEAQHTVVDELEWRRENGKLDELAREWAVEDLISLINGIDGLLQLQAYADADYFQQIRQGTPLTDSEARQLQCQLLAAYRWQFIISSIMAPRFANLLGEMISRDQRDHFQAALAPLLR